MAKIVTYSLSLHPLKKNEYWSLHIFKTFLADNGNAIYTVDGKIVDKDAGNEMFKKLCEGKKAEKKITELELCDDEIKDYLLNSMDQWVEMIDNYQQYKAAQESNARIMDTLQAFEKIAG